jgi:maltose alpha-D-glucosyltransferase/alpha-amylase
MMSTPSLSAAALLKASDTEVPPFVEELLGSHLPAVRRLGQRTGELHSTPGAARAPSDLAPEPFSILYQRSAYQSLRGLTRSVLQTLRERLPVLGVDHRADAVHVVAAEQELLHRCRPLLAQRLTAVRIACHGNYHLRQVLRTGEDFVIIDFEGEPARPLFERRLKRSPLVDVGSMVRSFYYAAGVALHDEMSGTADGSDAVRDLHRWSMFWCHWIAAAFLRAYRSAVDSALLPADPDQLRLLVELSLLERTLYELGYELAHRPGWAYIPLRDLRRLLEHRPYALAS